MIEKYSNLLADELYSLKIAVTTVRINEDYKKPKSMFNSDSKLFKKYFGEVFGKDLDTLMLIFICCKSPAIMRFLEKFYHLIHLNKT